MIAPSLEELAGEYDGKLTVAESISTKTQVPTRYGVRGIPTLIFHARLRRPRWALPRPRSRNGSTRRSEPVIPGSGIA
jgi:hypothetical protein